MARGRTAENIQHKLATAAPKGAAPLTTEFAGAVFDHDGRRLPDGTHVEAYVGTTRCGVASVRTQGDFTGFSLAVVGPESVAGCSNGATITFRVNGQQAIAAVNDFVAFRRSISHCRSAESSRRDWSAKWVAHAPRTPNALRRA